MIFFNSKYLSSCLGINLAKWKRWSREFLDPDPLGGFQSGYARQFSNKDAFKVFLGGYLVGELKFTITDAGQILSDLHSWLTRHQFYALPMQNSKPPRQYHHIYIYRREDGKFGYAIRRLTEPALTVNGNCYDERFGLKLIGLSPEFVRHNDFLHASVLSINALHRRYLALVYQES
jgi:hypothetical protein